MKEKEKMIQGEVYNPIDIRLVLERNYATKVCRKYNKASFHEWNLKNKKLRKLLHTTGNFIVKPPFYCDYGYNIFLGENVMINYGCTLLDVCSIRIGDHTLIGPNTQIYTACHAIDPQVREKDIEFGKPVTIGKNVWIGGGAIILPGVSIGDHSVIGAGSVVTKDIPANVVAVGNPCRVIKSMEKNPVD